ncbi:MAG TPA: bifunctional phosphoribosylaminoimidazolecarboxamide formyltransferase/IMP cyclohydrolase [Streptosporangiaceae bacterium]
MAVSRALISVHDKTGLTELARGLHEAGVQIVSTGSTAAAIAVAGLPVTRVEDITGFPECLDGRVKTLHPGVHAGLLADVRLEEHRRQLAELGVEPFGMLISSLYPFEQTLASGAPPDDCVEQIDIGGPAMVRAAAKNHGCVAVITEPAQYAGALAAVRSGGFTAEQRRRLAARAFARTAAYDTAVASWFASAYAPDQTARETGWPDTLAASWTRRDVLRYGENPHQRAAVYLRPGAAGGAGIAGAEQLHGKQMSFNNYVDAAAARRAAYDFAAPCVAIIKHSNPCGIAVGADLAQAHRKAHACDPESAYGGVIAVNGTVTAELAGQVAEIFTEVLVAPEFEAKAVEILTARKNLRLLRCPPRGEVPPGGEATPGAAAGSGAGGAAAEWRLIDGGLLVQSPDLVDAPGDDPAGWQLKAGEPASAEVLADLVFAWRACRSVKSNAILLAAGGASVGIGMGQVNRVDSCRLAVRRAGERARGSVGASDAYFPFPDGLEVLIEAGVRAVAEPGGSIRDRLSIDAAQAAGLTLYFTGVRHFYH